MHLTSYEPEAFAVIIDHQAHWYPPAYLDTIVDRVAYPRAERLEGGGYRYELGPSEGDWKFNIGTKFTSIEEQIASLDASGIGAMVLSPNMVGDGAYSVGAAESTAILTLLNQETARVQREYPGRIFGLCMLPFQDTDAALELLDEAADMDLRGILLPSNICGEVVSRDSALPVFERIDQLGLPIFVHPASNSMLYDRQLPGMLDSSVGWMYDSSLAVLSLIVSGILDKCPNIQLVHYHLGGVIPYIVGRVDRYSHYSKVKLEHPIEHYLKTRCWVDVVTHTPAAIQLAVDFYGSDRLLYGADHPWHDHPTQLELIKDHMSADLAQLVLHENRIPSLRID